MRILITGAAGGVARKLRPRLTALGHDLVLVDTTGLTAGAGERFMHASIADEDALEVAMAGVDLVVHLAAFPSERPWEQMVELNITGTRTVLEAARLAGVRRVLLASSIHAVGLMDVMTARDSREPAPHPDTYYGVSKAATEALGRLYAGRFGMTVVAARIGTATEVPEERRSLSTWVSPDDLTRLVVACLTTTARGGHVVWAVSDNTRRVVSLEAGRVIGYHPQDDAEAWAQSLGDPDPLDPSARLGGVFVDDEHPVGGDW